MNIAVVTAHPDDAEILMGGTIVRYRQKGHSVTIVICTNGEVGSSTLPKEEIIKVREREAREGAKILGADLIWLGYPDMFLMDTLESRLAVLNATRSVQADVVFTHYPDFYNPDHNTTSKIANDITPLQDAPNIKTKFPPTKAMPTLYFMDTITGVAFDPVEYVDISEVFDVKKKALLAHKTQYTWLKEHTKIDYADLIDAQSRLRGYQAGGVKYAEAFRHVNTYPRGIVNSLLPQYV